MPPPEGSIELHTARSAPEVMRPLRERTLQTNLVLEKSSSGVRKPWG